MALNVNIIGRDSEGNLRALKVNSEGNLDLGQLETEIQAVKDNQGRLYGKYGEAWIPVKVDSEGRPIIASDVTVNVEGVVADLGQIKQGPAGTEPWPVQLSGTKVVESAPVTGIKTVTSTVAEVFAGSSRKANRSKLIIRNLHQTIPIRIGGSNITDTIGQSLEPGASVEIDFSPSTAVLIYAVSTAGNVSVEVLEV